MFGSLGLPELIVIFVIILLIFGGRKLPEVGQNLGKAIRSFKDGISGASASDGEKSGKTDSSAEVREMPREEEGTKAVTGAGKEKTRDPVGKG